MSSFRLIQVFATVALLLCSPIVALSATASKADDVAKVGNVIVTQLDVEREVQKRLPLQVSFHGGINPEKMAEIKAESFDAAVTRAYKVQYAIDEEVAVDPVKLDADWQEMRARAKVPPGMAPEEAARQLELMKASLYLDALAKAAMQDAVEQHIDVQEEEVKAYYKENKERYYRPKLYTASQIFISVEPAATAEERAAGLKKAEALLEQARAGEDFYNLAYYNSDDRTKYVGGSLGTFHAGQTVEEFDVAVQKMEPGEIAGPVKTIYGYHVIRLDDVQVEKQMEYDEVAPLIRKQLVKDERKQLYDKWMAGLREKYTLQRYDQ
jgi:parvulin-like peptidyl-prolyl isomerase